MIIRAQHFVAPHQLNPHQAVSNPPAEPAPPDGGQPLAAREGADGSRIVALDTLRGIAVLMVVTFHVALLYHPGRMVGWLMSFGFLGVQVFYLVSAFTMCHMWHQRAGEPRPALRFYLRRFSRIAPPFWAAMALYTVWRAQGWHAPAQADAMDWLLTGGFMNAFSPHAINLLVPGGWSIAVEMFFYLVFPGLVARLPSIESRLWAAWAAMLTGAALMMALWPAGSVADWPEFAYYSPFTQLPVFLLGMAVYQIISSNASIYRPTRVLLIAFLFLTSAAVIRFLSVTGRPVFWAQIWILTGLMWWCMRGLNIRWLALIGRISYSIYLIHVAVLDLVVIIWPPRQGQNTVVYMLALAAVVAAAGALSWLSMHTLEKWSIRMGRSLVRVWG